MRKGRKSGSREEGKKEEGKKGRRKGMKDGMREGGMEGRREGKKGKGGGREFIKLSDGVVVWLSLVCDTPMFVDHLFH